MKKSIVGSPVRVDWAEVDPGQTTVSFSIPLSVKFKVSGVEISTGLTFGISRVGAAIVQLGNNITFYCDPIAMAHNTGSKEYRLR